MNAYQRISRYKSQLMGIAILIVVYGHFFYYHSGLKDYTQLNITMWYTVGSVDIFMFLSGFGIYHSLSKNDNPLRFLQRRMSRLLPVVSALYRAVLRVFSGGGLDEQVPGPGQPDHLRLVGAAGGTVQLVYSHDYRDVSVFSAVLPCD